jgi:hypothetical protein
MSHFPDRCLAAVALVASVAFAGIFTPATVMATTVPFCVGDCDGDDTVTVDEIIRGIGIALAIDRGTTVRRSTRATTASLPWMRSSLPFPTV